jgi:hypothetical protein
MVVVLTLRESGYWKMSYRYHFLTGFICILNNWKKLKQIFYHNRINVKSSKTKKERIMKIVKHIITTVVLLFAMLAFHPAMATQPVYGDTTSAPGNSGNAPGHTNNGNGNGNGGYGNGNGNGNNLPINNGIVFLLAAGLVIGIRIIATANKKDAPLEV